MPTEIPHVKIAPEEEPVQSNTEYYKRRRKMADYLSDEVADFDRILRPGGTMESPDPLALMGAYYGHALALDDAENNIQVTADRREELFEEYTGACIVDTVDTLNEAIDTVGSSLNQLRPSSAAQKARELMAKAFADHEPDEYSISDFFSCYFLTLLSGDSSVCIELHEKAKGMFGHMSTAAVHLQIQDFIRRKPEKLTTITRVYKEAASDVFNDYNLYHLVDLLTSATNTIIAADRFKHYRKVMLAFADQVTFNREIRDQLAVAEKWATPQPETVPEVTVDWEILPPGQLEEFAREIVEAAQNNGESTNPSIDLHRLQILEKIRHQHGVDTSYYAKGIRKTRRIIREGDLEQPDEYILLVLQKINEEGQLIGEDVIAESPISGPNALYVQRQDVNGWDWRELMAYPKPDTRDMGARSVKHTVPEGRDLIEWMVEKVTMLLDSAPDEFLHGEFKGVDKAGKPRLRIPPRVLSTILAQQELLK